ncbi:MAG: ATP-binding protein [Chloroflexota bacterium]
MTGHFYLDWAIMAASLFNTILMLWLGLALLLNAEHRTWGVWLAGGSLLLGAAFFVSHSAILGYGLDFAGVGLNLWWRLGWLPVTALPFTWYAIMLWYTGHWDRPRHRSGLLLTFGLLVGLIGWLTVASPLPTFAQLAQFKLSARRGFFLFLLIFPLYISLCSGLAVGALRHPVPSERMMGDEARQRARPWLLAASVMLMLVSLLVAGLIAWVLLNSPQGTFSGSYTTASLAVGWFDLLAAGLIGLTVILMGQAIVAYEVFTGKALPRREFKRQWYNAIILAGGYGLAVGWSFSLPVRPIYSLLLTALLMTLFYALLSWRSYTWRERYIQHLRPFVTSQQLYERLLIPAGPTPPQAIDMTAPFQALCRDVLGAQLAYLIPLGALAPLVRPLAYPADRSLPAVTQYGPRVAPDPTPALCISVAPAQAGGARWAVPLWSERGQIGVFLLGPKQDGGLYTQEEIEIARASGERLIDTRASAEIAQRLMTLQRQRLAESQLLDRQARRVLHDDVLPQLHTALLTLGGAANDEANAETMALLAGLHHQLSDLLRQLPKATAPALAQRGLVSALQEVAVDELAGAFDRVAWQIEPAAETLARQLPALTTEVLFYAAREALRNAARHARPPEPARPLQLSVSVTAQAGLSIQIEDDGVGLDASRSPHGGQGLTLHSAMLAIVGGVLDVESQPNVYTRVTIRLPQAALEMHIR